VYNKKSKAKEVVLTYILVIIAAICNAVMDTIKHHWGKSKLTLIKNPFLFKFFHKDGWMNSYTSSVLFTDETRKNTHPFFLDGWHFCKSIMLASLLLAIVSFGSNPNPLLHFFLLQAFWVGTFNLFYNDILKK
jgi:hypothetical protein